MRKYLQVATWCFAFSNKTDVVFLTFMLCFLTTRWKGMTRQHHCGSSPSHRNTAPLWYIGRANTDIYMHKADAFLPSVYMPFTVTQTWRCLTLTRPLVAQQQPLCQKKWVSSYQTRGRNMTRQVRDRIIISRLSQG